MNRFTAGFATLVTGAVVVYLLGAVIYCSFAESLPVDRALTRAVGVAAGATAIVFFAFLMCYLDALTRARAIAAASPTTNESH